MKTLILSLLCGLLLLCSCHNEGRNERLVSHVLVLGIDGLGSHGLEHANTPNIDQLMKSGAWTLHARSVFPSVSGPAWISMITGATVEKHGVVNNGWTAENHFLEPVIKGDFEMFPTIFGETRRHIPEAVIAAFYHWRKLGNFIEKGVCDISQAAGNEDSVTMLACKFIHERKPDLTFVHLDHVDHAGHHDGYRSQKYFEAIEKTDSLVGIFLDQLKRSGLFEETVVFLVSDHGGLDKGHGGIHPDEMVVPFLVSGKGIKKDYAIDHPLFIYDLAPTVAMLLGFELNGWISGKPLSNILSSIQCNRL